MLPQPREVRLAAGTVAVSWVAETKLVWIVAPFNRTVVAPLKPVPVSTICVSDDPIAMPAGEIAVSVGERLSVFPLTVTEALAVLFDDTLSVSDALT
jgi:hypothetical protein